MWTDRKMKKKDSVITKMPDTQGKVRVIIALGIINILLAASYFVLTYYAVRMSRWTEINTIPRKR